MKIVGFDNVDNMTNEQVQKDINERNFEDFGNECKVLRAYLDPKSNLKTVIIDVPMDLHKCIKVNRNELCVEYKSCEVHEIINIKPC